MARRMGSDDPGETGDARTLAGRCTATNLVHSHRNPRFQPKAHDPGGRVRCAAPAQIYEIAEETLRRDYREHVVRGVLGGTFRRVAGQVWK